MSVSIAGDGTITGFDAGASGFGGLVAVKHVLKTDTWSASVTAGSSSDVTDLSITHTLADSANKLIVSAFFGAAASSGGLGETGIGMADDGTLVNIGDAASTRTRVTVGGAPSTSVSTTVVVFPSFTYVYAPGDTASHTYTIRAINISTSTRTLYVGRSEVDDNFAYRSRAASAFVIQEVAV